MARITTAELASYLLAGRLSSRGCLQARPSLLSRPVLPRAAKDGCLPRHMALCRASPIAPMSTTARTRTRADAAPSGHDKRPQPPLPTATTTATATAQTPLRKKLKEEAKASKAAAKAAGKATKGGKNSNGGAADKQTVPGWELTVGIEIHAQLNTSRKLFSAAPTGAATAAASETSGDNKSEPGEPDDISDTTAATAATAATTALRSPTTPNSLIAPFDLAMPGSQPIFQPATLIPAIRAALALNCTVQRVSRFDRKHYFHWDQPSGYQITQYYAPLAVDGYVDLRPRDGIAPQDVANAIALAAGTADSSSSSSAAASVGEKEEVKPGGKQEADGSVRIRIKQVQMEQDTAKTLERPSGVHWLDFNRAGSPLIEIITQPDIHHPATAAAFVRKVQLLLDASDACIVGMENGGLRADVNVSVRRTPPTPTASAAATSSLSLPLGQRTEIKNLSSFKAVEDAIIAERDRQIAVLEAGGAVEGETRGFSVGGTETRRLRGKEGEVDYRYMPDPDLAPVYVADEVVEFLGGTMGVPPDGEIDALVGGYGLSEKDAMSLVLLDGGGRVEFYYRVVDALEARLLSAVVSSSLSGSDGKGLGQGQEHRVLAANWILHVLGSLTSENNARERAAEGLEPLTLGIMPDGHCEALRAEDVADILFFLHTRRLRHGAAKDVLFALFNGNVDPRYLREGGGGVERYVEDEGLWFDEMSDEEYGERAVEVVDEEEEALRKWAEKTKTKPGGPEEYPMGKTMFLVGKMMRGEGGRMDPVRVQEVVKEVVRERLMELRGDAKGRE